MLIKIERAYLGYLKLQLYYEMQLAFQGKQQANRLLTLHPFFNNKLKEFKVAQCITC